MIKQYKIINEYTTEALEGIINRWSLHGWELQDLKTPSVGFYIAIMVRQEQHPDEI